MTQPQSRAATPSPSSSRVGQFSMKDISSHLTTSTKSQVDSAPQSPFVASSASSEASTSESEGDDSNDVTPPTKRARRKLDNSPSAEEVSPTSVHNVPRDLSPLNLDYLSSPSKKIGVYTPRSRQELLRKYMEKRARRLSQNTVRYRVRKTLANARPRVKGRFVKTEQPLTAALVQSMNTD
ncbi:TPA: hypothetical protein N0F65_001437 [Lagenidium giganteum]|uniref:CCT domain-containing protein n=1 Tax=Lagenidium giganteum TaxID=4803 RepID=A0AAV2Z1K8_9STRA|nr:TPA: hypothetical protein N0F65_001437 [Lagenidium giganteum]